MGKITKSVSLYYQEGGSDKVYNASIEEVTGGYNVNFSYGRRGSALTTGTKNSSPLAAGQAEKVYNKLVSEKTCKGYKVSSQSGGSSSTPTSSAPIVTNFESKDTGIRPQLLNEIGEEDVEKYIKDPSYCAQEKNDGRRRMFIKTGAAVVATNRKGLSVVVDKVLTSAVGLIETERIILDGEDMGNHVMVFDMIDFRMTYKQRYEQLENVLRKFKVLGIPQLKLVETAWTENEKRDMFDKLKSTNAEGIVFKRVDSLYVPGRPNSGGDQLKFKFCATATCMVCMVHPTKRSIELGMMNHEDKMISVGNCTVYPNMEIPKVGTFVEVKYLYYFPGGSLFQPVLLGERDDQDANDCKISSLKVKRENAEV